MASKSGHEKTACSRRIQDSTYNIVENNTGTIITTTILMDSMQGKKNAAAFASEWSGRGYEKGDAQVFWTKLLQRIVGMQSISRNVRF